jgi:hypothetical protein
MVSMNKLTLKQRAQVLGALVEGNSIRATVRMTGAAKNTVVKLLADVGSACLDYQDQTLRNLTCERIQRDEIWSFCYAKDKNVPKDKQGQFGYGDGDVWTWTSLCADTKLVPCWLVGRRDADTANEFMLNLSGRLSHRVQLTTDGYKVYLNAVRKAFGGKGIDYAMLVKVYGPEPEGQKRYSPAPFAGVSCRTVARQAEQGTHLHQLRRAPEPDYEDEHEAVYQAD